MNDERPHFVLKCKDSNAPTPVLSGVQAFGRLDAVMFDLTLRQTYRNTSDKVLEVIYTFPLPPMAVLLGFASELNGARQDGVVVAKREAERQYEESLLDGDSPVMLEAHSDGLHTANIGNLKPGEEIVLEARFTQLLRFEQGRLRVSIPMTIAPRYGNPEQTGLQPQQVPLASLEAEYPLILSLTLGAALTCATPEYPTHRFITTQGEDGTARLTLAPGARLDRDVVVILTPKEPHPSLLVRADNPFDAEAPVVMMAAFQPPMGAPRERIALKLLVDCSGSMNGDSIASARAALRGVSAGLKDRDQVSLSRFGSSVEHAFAPTLAKPQALRHLQPLIDGIRADLGGTAMEEALNAVFALPHGPDYTGADVLLITDGEIWQAKEMIAAACSSGHRVFAIGVGSSPAEGVLRALAEATGGACEFATPGEALEAAAQRMLHRIRQPLLKNVRIDWGSTTRWISGPTFSLVGMGSSPAEGTGGASELATTRVAQALAHEAAVIRMMHRAHQRLQTNVRIDRSSTTSWISGPTSGLFGGDTVIAFAGFSHHPQPNAVRLLADDAQGKTVELARSEAEAPCPGDSLARISASRRMTQADSTGALTLALQYQLMSEQTNCILVHQRAETDKATEQAELHRVTSMAAAGWGGLGSVSDLMCTGTSAPDEEPSAVDEIRELGHVHSAGSRPERAFLVDIARTVERYLTDGGSVNGLSADGNGISLHIDVLQALNEIVQLGLSLDQAWLLLVSWVNTRKNGLADATLAALLQPLVIAIDAGLADKASEVFEHRLGGYPINGWTRSRTRRRRRELNPMGS